VDQIGAQGASVCVLRCVPSTCVEGYPIPSSPEVSARMARTRGRDTKPELLIRSAMHRRGLRFRVDAPPIAGLRRRADVLFTRARVAVYVDGCFFHGCPIHATWPKHNANYWRQKIERNRDRDEDTNRRLDDAGWVVIRAWEHEDPEDVADRVARAVRQRLAERCPASSTPPPTSPTPPSLGGPLDRRSSGSAAAVWRRAQEA
jgi:DNA mismatch endonuclease, patch repair protein